MALVKIMRAAPSHVILDTISEEVDEVREARRAAAGRHEAAGKAAAAAATVNVQIRGACLAMPTRVSLESGPRWGAGYTSVMAVRA